LFTVLNDARCAKPLFTTMPLPSSAIAPLYSEELLLVKMEFDSVTSWSFSGAPSYSEVLPVKAEPLIGRAPAPV
jgi:hypothetical protein